jgi:A/G-specific adenine glycosylase
MNADSLRESLLSWYRLSRRDLPWRRTRDPYAILVSEAMLQQTRVDVVEPYFRSWMERFPDVRTLAEATEDEVLAAFSGLGYYRRARSLRAAARHVLDHHGGTVPGTVEDLRALPGVGDYTAGAVASIAFARKEPAIDGNVHRVASRILRLEQDPRRGEGKKRVEAFARSLLEKGDPGSLNQALMELGATICTPRSPRCLVCPVHVECRSAHQADVEEYPKGVREKRAEACRALAAAVMVEGKVLLVPRSGSLGGGVLEGMCEVPFVLGPASGEEADLEQSLLGILCGLGLSIRLGEVLGEVRHTITFRRIRATVRAAVLDDRAPKVREEGELLLVSPEDPGTATSSFSRKILRLARPLSAPADPPRPAPSRRHGNRG